MAAFGIFAIAGTGMGPVVAGWTEQNPRFEWRWIQWFHVMYELLPSQKKIGKTLRIFLHHQCDWIVHSFSFRDDERDSLGSPVDPPCT